MPDILDHGYISTACWHGYHDECRKVCKFCGSGCRCECYIKRAQHKDNLLQNLQKARWYLDREIADVERQLNIPRAPASTDPLSADAAKRKYVGITSESGHSIALASTLPTDAAKS